MSLYTAIRFTEMLLALAFIQQSIEHLCALKDERRLFLLRIFLSILLMFGLSTRWVCILLFIHGAFMLKRFQGPYNGGSDRMGLFILSCLCLIHFMPALSLQKYIFGYLALQLILSYFVSGCFKITNPKWWNGQVLQDLFRFSNFPATEALRSLADRPGWLCLMSWAAILFELLFPLALFNQTTLIIGLLLALGFHLANTFLFGLNRFFWVWLAAYPSLIWFQSINL
jgi:hypothetical protein